MNVFIAEDEAPARERLLEALARLAPHARVVGAAASVRDTAAWLAAHSAPDLLLLDIQLADGLSLELFRQRDLACPVIFTTAYDQFVLQAFQAHAVDYLLKPIQDAQLRQALDKHERWRNHAAAQWAGVASSAWAGLLQQLHHGGPAPTAAAAPRQRVLGRQGTQHISVPVDQVAYFVSDAKLCFAVTADARRLLLDEPLAHLEQALDPARFFRINRQYLVHVQAVLRFSAAGKGRLNVQLQPPPGQAVQVSQERAAAFRGWLNQ